METMLKLTLHGMQLFSKEASGKTVTLSQLWMFFILANYSTIATFWY